MVEKKNNPPQSKWLSMTGWIADTVPLLSSGCTVKQSDNSSRILARTAGA